MGLLKDFIGKYKSKKEKYKEIEDDVRFNHRLEEKQKSADKRELERYYKEEEERAIKEQLKRFRQRRMNEIWGANSFTGNKNLMRDNSLMKSGNKIKLASCRLK